MTFGDLFAADLARLLPAIGAETREERTGAARALRAIAADREFGGFCFDALTRDRLAALADRLERA